MLWLLLACQHPAAPPTPSPPLQPPALLPLMQADDPIVGDPYAKYTLMEFSDFQCPFCQRFFPQLIALVDANPDVRLIFKHYPLSTDCNPNMHNNLHEHACGAARAATCAHRAGRFRAMAEFLFVYPYLAADMNELGKKAAMTPEAMADCMNAPQTQAELSQDLLDGATIGVNGTPTLLFYTENTWVELAPNLTSIVDAIPGLTIP